MVIQHHIAFYMLGIIAMLQFNDSRQRIVLYGKQQCDEEIHFVNFGA